MNKWLTRFKENTSPVTDTPATMHTMSITSVPVTPISQKSAPIVSTVSVLASHNFEKYQEVYLERAAIMQHDNSWSLEEANHWGLREAVYAWVRDHHQHIITQITTSPIL